MIVEAAAVVLWGFIAVSASQGGMAVGPFDTQEACKAENKNAFAHPDIIALSPCVPVKLKADPNKTA